MMNTIVSIVVTAYGRKEFLMQALRSIEKQTVSRELFEVILVKNFTDDSIDRYCDDNGIISVKMSGSIGEFLNSAIEISRGIIIAFLDDDDEWLPEKLESVIQIFNNDKQIGYFHNDYSFIDDKGKIIRFKRVVESRKKEFKNFTFPASKKRILDLLEVNADFNLSCMAVRRDLIFPLRYELSKIRGGTDSFVFFISLLGGASIYVSSIKLTRYRVHKFNVSRSIDLSKKVIEIERELSSLYTLENIFVSDSIRKAESYKTLEMLKTEYEILCLIFSSGDRISIIKKILILIRFPRSSTNPLRLKVVIFAMLYFATGSLSHKIYQRILN